MSNLHKSFVLLVAGMGLIAAGLAALWPPLLTVPGVALVWMSTLNGGDDGSA